MLDLLAPAIARTAEAVDGPAGSAFVISDALGHFDNALAEVALALEIEPPLLLAPIHEREKEWFALRAAKELAQEITRRLTLAGRVAIAGPLGIAGDEVEMQAGVFAEDVSARVPQPRVTFTVQLGSDFAARARSGT